MSLWEFLHVPRNIAFDLIQLKSEKLLLIKISAHAKAIDCIKSQLDVLSCDRQVPICFQIHRKIVQQSISAIELLAIKKHQTIPHLQDTHLRPVLPFMINMEMKIEQNIQKFVDLLEEHLVALTELEENCHDAVQLHVDLSNTTDDSSSVLAHGIM